MNELIQTPEGIWVLKEDSHLSRWIEELKRLDVANLELKKFRQFIPVGGYVVDAGASLGDHTATYSDYVGPTGRVFAFEPNPLSFQALKRNFERTENVSTFNYALGCEHRSCAMQLQTNVGASFVLPTPGEIQMVTLDEVIPDIPRLDFIHLDCEGFELPSIRGGAKLIAKFRPVILLEIASWVLERNGLREKDVTDYLASIGYCWREAEPGYDSRYPQRDILALPA